ncbi:PREDICTED: uncharacterized protein LOC105451159 [Wasmannia auropunctata]|uniref:uncharacterized protein LOC105451159 n=1 Tax=Wasmannia auropunctata TaxID=64793 RepID=UPI0005EF55CA|nr:PREDICTED: uncharacterized protein LOC105451159 [Wasmannia auropunctata]
MSSTLLLNCVLAAWLLVTIGAITVSIDRADIKTPPTRSSMIANGWRPLTNSYEETIGTNVSPSSHLEKNVQVHPVLSKFQEHMATSEKLKPLRKGKPPVHEYSPPSILGSFTVFGHAATKARGETKTPSKHVATETREYTFLIPPPKDAYRFEVSQHRKPVVRDSGAYLPRQPPPQASAYIAAQNVHQQPPDTIRAATYFIKGFSSNRPYVPPFAMPQALQPPRQPEKTFESLKVANSAKPYFQPPGAEIPSDFGKQKIGGDGDIYRYPAQSHNSQVISSASTGNFYSQVNHPANHYKSTYERDPAFLVHESHEVSYATPPGTYSSYSFRPSLPYETLLPPSIYSSTPPSTTAVTRNPASKFGQANDATREQNYNKRPEPGTRNKQEKGGQTELPNPRTTSTYYVAEHLEHTPPTWPKSKYTSDNINEVLPKENPPSKFSQEVVNQNQITQGPKIVYHRPQSSFEPVEVYPPTTIPNYETPESISLKHFNEQQFLLQQQLLLRDRQRLAEQERQQKLEIERQQQEELKKQQEQIDQLAQRENEDEEAARFTESAKNQSQDVAKISGQPYAVQLAQYEPQVTTDGNILVSQPGIYNIEQLRLQPQVSQFPENQVNQNYQYQQHYQNGYQEQQVRYREPQTETRPYRPQKPSRDPQRRKKPTATVVAHELSPTDPPSQPPDTAIPLTLYAEDVPIQTTVVPEVQTAPTATTQRSRERTRRPAVPNRRRKPATTTQESVTTSYPEEDYLKYNREDVQHNNQHDSSRRRRIKPTTQPNYNEDAEKRGGNVRKRPSHRTKVSHDESYDAQIVTENVPVSLNAYGQTTEPSYEENNQFATNQPGVSYVTGQPINQYYDYASRQNEGYREDQREDSAVPQQAPEQVSEYLTEISRGKVEDYNVDTRQQNVNIATNIPLEDLYVKTDGNYYDRATTDAPTTATTTTTTTTTTPQPATQAPQVVTSTSRSHKIRPLRYGNATRPRFSIKDYKSRMDYKNRLSSTTEVAPTPSSEALTRGPHIRQRTSSAKSQQTQLTGDNVRETTGRYKYVSRVNYRTTTSSPTATREHDRYSEESASSTTEKTKFVPKRRPISGNVYRSRIASTTTSPTRTQISGETNVRQSSARPENVYSSSIRRRPIMKSRLQKESNADSSKRQEEPTEMAAEETSFYSTASSTGRLVGNEIVSEKGEAASAVKLGVQESKNQGKTVSQNEETRAAAPPAGDDRGQISSDETGDEQTGRVAEKPENAATAGSEDSSAAREGGEPEAAETTTKFDVQSDEEELFAKASQSVADLTSSASALYDKPGMFKAVSPESRLVSSQFKITTDEPTLPIEAFFQELSKKN